MNSKWKYIVLFSLFSGLSACMSMYKGEYWTNQCKAQNWEDHYFQVELKKKSELYPKYEDICEANGYPADKSQRALALKKIQTQVCIESAGYQTGRSGDLAPEACQNFDNYKAYKTKWNMGRKDYLILSISYLEKQGIYPATVSKYYGSDITKLMSPIEMLNRSGDLIIAHQKAQAELKFTPPAFKDKSEKERKISEFHQELIEIVKAE